MSQQSQMQHPSASELSLQNGTQTNVLNQVVQVPIPVQPMPVPVQAQVQGQGQNGQMQQQQRSDRLMQGPIPTGLSESVIQNQNSRLAHSLQHQKQQQAHLMHQHNQHLLLRQSQQQVSYQQSQQILQQQNQQYHFDQKHQIHHQNQVLNLSNLTAQEKPQMQHYHHQVQYETSERKQVMHVGGLNNGNHNSYHQQQTQKQLQHPNQHTNITVQAQRMQPVASMATATVINAAMTSQDETTDVVKEKKGRFSVLQEVKKSDVAASSVGIKIMNDEKMNNIEPSNGSKVHVPMSMQTPLQQVDKVPVMTPASAVMHSVNVNNTNTSGTIDSIPTTDVVKEKKGRFSVLQEVKRSDVVAPGFGINNRNDEKTNNAEVSNGPIVSVPMSMQTPLQQVDKVSVMRSAPAVKAQTHNNTNIINTTTNSAIDPMSATDVVKEKKGRFSVLQEVAKTDVTASGVGINIINVEKMNNIEQSNGSKSSIPMSMQVPVTAPAPAGINNTHIDSVSALPGAKKKGRFIVSTCDDNDIELQHVKNNSNNSNFLSDGQNQYFHHQQQNITQNGTCAQVNVQQQAQPQQQLPQKIQQQQQPTTIINPHVIGNNPPNVQSQQQKQQQQITNPQIITNNLSIIQNQQQQLQQQPTTIANPHIMANNSSNVQSQQQQIQQHQHQQYQQQKQHIKNQVSNKATTKTKTIHLQTIDRERSSSLPSSCNGSKSSGLSGVIPGGVGKMLHYFEQMKTVVIEADKMIKSLQCDIKHLQGKNKELEARVNDVEKRYVDEKAIREDCEAKINLLKKRLKEMMEKENCRMKLQLMRGGVEGDVDNPAGLSGGSGGTTGDGVQPS